MASRAASTWTPRMPARRVPAKCSPPRWTSWLNVAAERYRALLVANDTFPHDPQLRPLKGPGNDVQLLLEALTDRDRGLHAASDVEVVLNQAKDHIVEVMEA